MSTSILITGATGHVGSGMAIYFADQGHRVILAGRNEERLNEVAKKCGGAETHILDLNDRATIDALASLEVDWLINNAADVTSTSLMDADPESIARQVDANITGTILLTRSLIPGMIARGGGAVVNISSLAGYKSNPGQTVYSVTKSALNAFSEALRMELRNDPIHIVNVALASVSTTDAPGPGQVTTKQVAESVAQAIQRGRNEVYFSPLTRALMKLYGAFPALRLWRIPHST